MKRHNDFSGGLYILLVILVAVIILFAVAQPAGAVRCRMEGKPEALDQVMVELLACLIYSIDMGPGSWELAGPAFPPSSLNAEP